ncbi:alpha/beta fold hydrolase [Amycolatopsis sp. 195334CR]|uniref:alpha/beta fold hydrolase n=1 Tax=Amycolatopsis sp. 195334CR TaxID=2814588 RepID=UPI001A8E2161|nr:alpha/beta fold hydrolase [Amycolatopsis sp. 195334CR]MBN6033785.1 alpha/beta fold hydrolase [Amycolatopsis sp. 195334CR]
MREVNWEHWPGVRGETVDVGGTSAHLLRADGPASAPTQFLVHPMASGGVFWLDVLPSLTAHGPVVAVDLPGAVLGRTESPHRFAVRAEPSARFLRALTTALGLDRVVVHGWSFGGLVALLFADLVPARVERLVLTAPTLPGPLSRAERLGWQTLGRLALLVGPGLLTVTGSALMGVKQRNPRQLPCSPELAALIGEQLAEIGPRQLRNGVTAFASAVSAMFVDRHPAEDAIDRLAVPTLVLWGDQDPLIERATIDHLLARRPDWALHVFEGVGHLPPWEVPDAYASAVSPG